jgi:uncharacterized protein YoaH (UPF0181 family)
MIQNEHVDSWNKKAWMDEFLSSPRLANDLTSRYAEDIIQAVEEKDFNSLDDAIAELKTRVNLTASETSDIKRRVLASTDPAVFIAVDNIKKLSKSQLGDLLKLATEVCDKCEKAPCECTEKMSSVASKAVNFVGLEALAEMYDKCEDEVKEHEEEMHETEEKKAEAAVELTKEADQLKALMADGVSATEALQTVAKGMPEGLKNYLEKKKGGEGKSEEKKEEETDEKKAEAQASKWANFLSKQSWFQGADEASKEGKITSNNPDTLGYPKEVEYSHTELNPPVGDVRQYEQKEFEGAAAETAKVLGPSGEELELKKMWQRARYMAHVRRAAKAK